MALDTSIPLQGRPVQLDGPFDAQTKALTLRHLLGQSQLQDMQLQAQQQQFQRAQQLRSLIAGLPASTSDDDRINTLRAGGFFDEADKMQTGLLAREKSRAEASHLTAQAGKLTADTAEDKRAKAIQDIAAFETPEQARQSLIAHVQSGEIDPQTGSMLHASIPQDMGAFRQWQLGLLRRIMSAQEAAGQITPKLQTVNLGGTEQVVDLNPNTRGMAPTSLQRTQTPDSVALIATTRRGQDMTDARAREGNEVARQAARTQLVETPDGYALVDKGTGLARPAATMNGKQVQGKGGGLTDSQSKAYLFGARMQEADKLLGELSAQGTPSVSLLQQATGSNGVTGSIANAIASPKQQQVEQAQRDFVNAVLRRESGAAISDSEFQSARRQYFVQPGDSPPVVDQKARNRRLAIQGILSEVPPGQRPTLSGQSAAPGALSLQETALPPDIAAILQKHGGSR